MSIELLRDTKWLKSNEKRLKDIFPKVWTHNANMNMLGVGYRLKLIGIDWRSQDQLASVLTFLTRIGIVEVQNMTGDTTQMRRSSTPLNIKEE